MNILNKKTYLMIMYLFLGIFITNTSYGMDNKQDQDQDQDQDKNTIPMQKISAKPIAQKENSKQRIKNLPEEDLESEYGNISSSTMNRPDKFWVDEFGRRRYLEAN